MKYVIYHKDTTMYLTNQYFKTEGAAKAALTRKDNNGYLASNGYIKSDFLITDFTTFKSGIELQVEAVNLMSQEKFKQPANTPRSCDPSSEAFWSM